MAERLRIGVVGAGAIGGYVGGRLAVADDAAVAFVGRESQRAALAGGLAVQDFGGDAQRAAADRFTFATDVAAVRDCDAVLCCVKSRQTDEVARELAGVLRDDAVIASLQNGVRNPEVLRRHLGTRRVLGAVVGFNVVQRGDTFHRTTSGGLILERADEGDVLVAALRASGLDVALRHDIAPDQWTKLLVNLNNAVSALSGAPTRELLLSSALRKVAAAITAEALRVLRAAKLRPARLRGVPVGWLPFVMRLPTPIVRLLARAQLKVDPEARSSMYEDLRRGRPTEVDDLNGEIVKLAEAHGVAAPINRAIVEAVHSAEREQRGSPGLSAEHLRSLLGS